MDYLAGVLYILILILIVYFIVNHDKISAEHFDTYRNHDFGAYYVYNDPNIDLLGNKKFNSCTNKQDDNVNKAALIAKYDWSEKDPLGYNVYDYMYNNVVKQKIWGVDGEYGYRDVDTSDLDNVYDNKFSLLNNSNQMAEYNLSDMYDPNYVTTEFNGQTIYLSQKQY